VDLKKAWTQKSVDLKKAWTKTGTDTFEIPPWARKVFVTALNGG